MTELRFTDEQRAVIDCWGEGLAVQAGAGSGKTTTLVAKCLELIRRQPEARFAAVSFTERSTRDLRAKLSLMLPESSPLTRHAVSTIHGLCSSVIREYPRQAGFDGDEAMLSEPESQLLWERAVEGLWFEDLTEDLEKALDVLFQRESRDGIQQLLRRVRELKLFGGLDSLAGQEDLSSVALEKLGSYVIERYDRLKRRRGVLDFNDLEKGADQALNHAEVRGVFQRRFDLVLVDEFQDTNALQARILERFVRPDFSNLCVVGDPKQSIYRFRDADVAVFAETCRKLPQNLSLTWNFRSRPGIIDFSNQVCAEPFASSGLEYQPLVPKREPDPTLDPVIRLDVDSPEDLCRFILAEKERGIPLEDMALLVRKIRGNGKWLKALSSAGIPLAIGSGGLFWEDPRVRELGAFLKWWDDPASTLSGAAFLRAPWVGIDDETLDRWLIKDPTFIAPFFASSHRLAALLVPFRERSVRPGDLILALLEDEEVERDLGASALGLWHRAEEFSMRGMGFHAVVAELGLAIEESRRDRDVPPPKNRGQLLVLTIHGSKGLEFPHVILIDLPAKAGSAPDAPALYWDRVNGAFLARKDSDGERMNKDPDEFRWNQEERKKALAESKRLFYVALTRAQERLILVCQKTVAKIVDPDSPRKPSKPKPEVSASDKDFWRGWIEASNTQISGEEVPAASLSAQDARGADLPEPSSRIRLEPIPPCRPRYSVTEWNVLSRCERAYEWGYVRPVDPGTDPGAEIRAMSSATSSVTSSVPGAVASTVTDSATGSVMKDGFRLSQRELGTRVHACLERGDFEELKALELEVGSERFSAQPVIEWMKSSAVMAPGREDGTREVYPEFSFEIPIAGEVLVGSMDRLIVDRSGPEPRFIIVDFKVTEKMKTADELLEAYGTQLALYVRALEILEPEAVGRTEAVLINLSSRNVLEVAVPHTTAKNLERLAVNAREIVAGRAGLPRPGSLCRVCDFRRVCPDALKF